MSSALEFQKWASAPPSWIATPGQDLDGSVLSSRIRLARNLSGIPFPHRATPKLQTQVLSDVISTITEKNIIPQSTSCFLKDLDSLQREFLMERHLISPAHARDRGEKGLIVSSGEEISLMINEEDHIRVASFKAGFALDDAWEKLSNLDEELRKALPINYDGEFGFTTACPTNLGTGIRVSALLHLPALSLTGKIPALIPRLNNDKIVVRGFFGEGTQAFGDIFQLSNATTLGLTEGTILSHVAKAVRGIVTLERREERHIWDSERRIEFEDRIFRSWGTLKMARVLKFEETMKFISFIRMGVKLGMDIPFNRLFLTSLFFTVQPAHLMLLKGRPNDKSPDELRADYIREKLPA